MLDAHLIAVALKLFELSDENDESRPISQSEGKSIQIQCYISYAINLIGYWFHIPYLSALLCKKQIEKVLCVFANSNSLGSE